MAGGLRRIDCQVDVLTWRGGPRFKGEARLLRQLIAEPRSRRHRGRLLDPVGILTHHRDMDDPATWDFLAALLERTADTAAWVEPWPWPRNRLAVSGPAIPSLDFAMRSRPAWRRSGGALLGG